MAHEEKFNSKCEHTPIPSNVEKIINNIIDEILMDQVSNINSSYGSHVKWKINLQGLDFYAVAHENLPHNVYFKHLRNYYSIRNYL